MDATFQQKIPLWERVVLLLFPTLTLEGTIWRPLWEEERRAAFRSRMRFLTIGLAVFYVIQFFAVDIPAGVQPLTLWISYRFGMAAALMALFGLTFSRAFSERKAMDMLYWSVALVVSFLLARSKLWDSRIPDFLAVVSPVLLVMFYNYSMVASVAFLAALYSVQFPSLSVVYQGDPEKVWMLVSSYILASLFVAMFRSSFNKDVSSFVRRQLLIQERQKVIEAQKELTNQLKGFVPSEIFDRIISYNRKHRMNMAQATDEVIRPRRKDVACIYSDIRSFTQNSKDVDSYVLGRSIPNIRLMTETADAHRGISRLVGDLILAYFDQDDAHRSLLLACECGFEMAAKNKAFNANDMHNKDIHRNVIVTYGSCIVGNIGATDSAREITSLGPPINMANRIDTFIKSHASTIGIDLNQDLILSGQAWQALRSMLPEAEHSVIPLKEYSGGIRDFPEEAALYILCGSQRNRDLIRGKLTAFDATERNQTRERQEYSYGNAI